METRKFAFQPPGSKWQESLILEELLQQLKMHWGHGGSQVHLLKKTDTEMLIQTLYKLKLETD